MCRIFTTTVLPSSWAILRLAYELKRKLQHIRSDAMDRKRMRCGLKQKEPTWSEEYVKRSVKKKLEKSMFCEVCGLAIPSYSSVVIHGECDC